MAYLLSRREEPTVFNLKGAVEKLESQRAFFVGSWSQKVRNAALLKYYLMLTEICSSLGYKDKPEDTPHEFIGKASAEFEVQPDESARFAGIVDRAHYGEELTEEEVGDASSFMQAFTDSLTRRLDAV